MKYYLNKWARADGSHIVHKEGCPFLSGRDRQIFLGSFEFYQSAMEEGRLYFELTAACIYCLKDTNPLKVIKEYPDIIRLTFPVLQKRSDGSVEEGLLYCLN